MEWSFGWLLSLTAFGLALGWYLQSHSLIAFVAGAFTVLLWGLRPYGVAGGLFVGLAVSLALERLPF